MFFFIICPVLISLYNIAVLIIICRFESTLLLKYANPCRNWTFQRVASAGLKKGRNGTNEKSDDALATKQQWQNLNLYPYKLSDLIFTPLPSLHVDFFSTCCYLVFFFIICPVLISLYNIAVLIIICSFESTLLLKYANPCRNWTFQRVVSAGLGTNEKSDTRQNSNPGPRHF